MAGKPAVRVRGGPQLQRAFRNAAGRATDLAAAGEDAGELVASEARRTVPFVSGDLHDTIEVDRHETGADVTAGSSSVVYAGVIHEGSAVRGIEGQPFLRDALEHRRDGVVAAYADDVARQVKRFDREAP